MKISFLIIGMLFFLSSCNPITDAPGPSEEDRNEKDLVVPEPVKR